MAQKKRIGEVLKESGLIDDFQLEAALSHQRNWGGKLGAILVEMGFVREEDIARVLAERLHVPCVELFDPPISPAVLKILKPDTAKKYTVIPARKEGEAVLIAMADPLDIKTLDELRFITGLSVKPALASESDIKDTIREYDRAAAAEPAEPAPLRQASPALPKEEPLRQELSGVKLHVEALITLLLEKGLISRDELVRIIEHKKIGL